MDSDAAKVQPSISNTVDRKPNNVPAQLWEKFKALEKRTNEVTQKSTEKRIRNLQKQVLDTVHKEFTSPEDKSVLQKYDVKPLSSSMTSTSKRAEKRKAVDDISTSGAGPIDELNDFLNINEHLQQKDNSRPAPPTVLEVRINEAIKLGDVNTAESLSDHLATREMGERIVTAIEAKRFLEQRKKEEESFKPKKKKKLNWGFEPKHRWETKGNM